MKYFRKGSKSKTPDTAKSKKVPASKGRSTLSKSTQSRSSQPQNDSRFPDRAGGKVTAKDIERLYDSPGKTKLATTVAVAALAALALLAFMAALRLFLGLFGGGDPVVAEQSRVTREEDRPAVESLAESFSAAYLDVKVNDPEGAGAARVRPFISSARDPGTMGMARSDDEPLERRVITSSAYAAKKIRGGSWSVFTDNLVETRTRPEAATNPEDEEGAEGVDGAEEGENPENSAVVELEAGKRVERVGLEIFVALDEDGKAAVIAPPNLVAPRSSAVDDDGVLFNNSSPAQNVDPAISQLIEGYLAAAYGDKAARGTIDKFLVSDSTPPSLPPDGLEFEGVQNQTVFEAALPENAPDNWEAVADVEAYSLVSDPSLGLQANQTTVLRVAKIQDAGWLIAGDVDAVAAGSGLQVE